MNPVNTTSLAVALPACTRLATVCAAIEGREVTCPAAMQRICPTLGAIRHMHFRSGFATYATTRADATDWRAGAPTPAIPTVTASGISVAAAA